MSADSARARLGAIALGVAGVLFLLYPVLRPWHDETTLEGATAAMSSNAWIASHGFAMIGFILVPAGLFALRNVLSGTRAEPLAFAAALAGWLGAGLTLPYYGAETFGLSAIASAVAAGHASDLVRRVDDVRFGTVALASGTLGLVSLAVGAAMAATAIRKADVLPRHSGIPFALGFVLSIPQFFAPPLARIGHGLLLAVGSIRLAAVIHHAAPAS